MGYVGEPSDDAVAVLIDDIERGLSENILLVCCGEITDANHQQAGWSILLGKPCTAYRFTAED